LLLRVRALGFSDAWLAQVREAHLLTAYPVGELLEESTPAVIEATGSEVRPAVAATNGSAERPVVAADESGAQVRRSNGASQTASSARIAPAARRDTQLTRSIEPAPPGRYHGVHEAGDCEATFGWAWDTQHPDASVPVEVLLDGKRLGVVEADRFRPDLAAASKGNGAHGFSFELPAKVRDGKRHELRVRIPGPDQPLLRTPVSLKCPALGEMEPARGSEATGSAESGGRERDKAAAGVSKRMVAIRTDAATIRINGQLDDEVWSKAPFADDFQQKGPDRGFPARERTEVAFAYDDQALYVAARMHSRRPEELRALVGARDDPGSAERVLVSLDTYRDRRTAFTFGVTAGGARLDYHHPRDDEQARDPSFDPVWEARTTIDSAGWTAEMRIPFSELRFSRSEDQLWGVNVRRWSPERFLNVYWVVVPLYDTGWASRFGELVGLEGIHPNRRLSIRPYVLGGATFLDQEFLGPTDPNAEWRSRFGGDALLGLGPSLTLEATVNPDFGQVEADPAEVNLTQFETFFEEKRPFFVEANRFLRSPGPDYFYSRRIGAIPVGGVTPNVTEPPSNTTILGATKLTGRLESGLSTAGLVAVTQRETGRVGETVGDSAAVEVAPLTAYAAGRVQHEFGPAGSTAGFTLTSVHRSFEDGSSLESRLPRTAITGGGDWNMRLADGEYEVRGHLGFSHVAGDSAALLRVQRSSARYFQRPDAGGVRLDSSRTALSGYAAGLSFHDLGGQWLWELGGSVESPGFDLQDAGILSSADDVEAFAGVTYRQPRAEGPVRDYSVSLFLNGSWNTEGVRTYASPSLYGRVTWPNLWRSFLQLGVSGRALSDDLTRGGPLMGTPLSWSGRAALLSRFGAPTSWSANVSTYFDEFGGWSLGLNGSVSVRPAPRVEISISPGYNRSDDSRQFFGTFEGGPEATFGTRYVFAFLERSEMYAQFRANLAITPDLLVEAYIEPFASSGRFRDFGELGEARGRELRQYGEDDGTTIEPTGDGSFLVTDGVQQFTLWNSDFNIRSFRTSAVLRWEWSRGSTVYLIWQQNRWFFEDVADPVGPGSLLRTFGDPGEHILVAKVSYWLSLD
jgi:hypothetical protein